MPRKAAEDGAADQLTDNQVRDLAPPAEGNRVHYDGAVKGFGVRITSAGARAFVLNYRAAGRERRITIGSFPDWSVKKARDEAKALKRLIDQGRDPMAERHAERAAPTISDLADRFEAEHLPRKRLSTQDEYKRLLRVHIRPALGKLRVAELRHADIEQMHGRIAVSAPYAANRATAVVSKMLTLAVRWEMRADNPARGVERAPEEKRERFLTPAEIARLSDVLATHRERGSANAVRLLLLTGARKGETLAAKWQDFDLSAGVWVKPAATTKTAKSHRVPLSAPALALLAAMRADADKEDARRAKIGLGPIPFLFPSMDGKPLGTIKHFWSAICVEAGLAEKVEKKDEAGKQIKDKDGKPVLVWQTTARIHDLRHTYASILASSGLSLPIIGALLGHTQAATTQRYAHLMDDPLRAATERAGAVISGAGRPSAEVVQMPSGRRA